MRVCVCVCVSCTCIHLYRACLDAQPVSYDNRNTRNIHGTLSRQKRKGIKHRDMLWKEGKVPYMITEGDFGK